MYQSVLVSNQATVDQVDAIYVKKLNAIATIILNKHRFGIKQGVIDRLTGIKIKTLRPSLLNNTQTTNTLNKYILALNKH
jgi:hypothetical protein